MRFVAPVRDARGRSAVDSNSELRISETLGVRVRDVWVVEGCTKSLRATENGPAFQSAERPGEYRVIRPVTVDEVFAFIRQELERQFFRKGLLTCPEDTKRYLIAQLAREEREVFVALFFDNRHRLLAFEKLFYGTIDGCSVHPREVVRRTLPGKRAGPGSRPFGDLGRSQPFVTHTRTPTVGARGRAPGYRSAST